MKIGLLTFHQCINYGSYWQARLLVEDLRSRGHDAVLLEARSRRMELAEWRCALRPLDSAHTHFQERSLYAQKTRRVLEAIALLPRSRGFALDRPWEMDDFDMVIIGSDEVWNLEHPWYGGCPLYFGEGIQSPRVVAYAASCGNYRGDGGLPEDWGRRLRRLEHISVRDENTRRIVERSIGNSPELVLDPCLQFPSTATELLRAGREPARPWVAIYGHSFSEWMSQEVRRWAARRGLCTVSIGYRNDWADEQWIAAGPEDFARLMARSQAIVTNFFHGCVFALRHAVPFACESSSYRHVKIGNLLTDLGAEVHLLRRGASLEQLEQCLGEPLPPLILRRITARRSSSQAFIERVLTTSQRRSERHHAQA